MRLAPRVDEEKRRCAERAAIDRQQQFRRRRRPRAEVGVGFAIASAGLRFGAFDDVKIGLLIGAIDLEARFDLGGARIILGAEQKGLTIVESAALSWRSSL